MSRISIILFVLTGFILCSSCQNKKTKSSKAFTSEVLISPMGHKLISPAPTEKSINLYEAAKLEFEKNPQKVENHIWYGRRVAYLANYNEAINIYTKAIKKFPNEARLYRHRGHRYISIRNFDAAIADLERASELIKGTENSIEPDGLPNAFNIPISTLHGNIYYHLGLAYYLKHDYNKAYRAFKKCRDLGSNDDNLVSSTHWLYMILQRLEKPLEAEQMLLSINDSLNIIENNDYYKLCKFYKGLIAKDSLRTSKIGPNSDALNYGLANWYFYSNNKAEAQQIFRSIIDANSWNSFGYIAAESDLLTYY